MSGWRRSAVCIADAATRCWQFVGRGQVEGKCVQSKLDTKGMTHSENGMQAIPGKNLRRKPGVNRQILATGSGAIRQVLEYKAGELIEVPAANGSQTCSECGVADVGSRNVNRKSSAWLLFTHKTRIGS